MKNRIAAAAIIVALLILQSCEIRMYDYTIYRTYDGHRMSMKRLAQELSNYDIVIFGDYPGNDAVHYLQKKFLEEYLQEVPTIALSMEIFNRDSQPVLDSYMLGEIEEDDFIKQAGLRHTYKFDHRPIVEFARRESIPIIAAAVPPKILTNVRRYGLRYLDQIPVEERFLFSEAVETADDAYRDMFFANIADQPGFAEVNQFEMDERLENLYEAQMLAQETMAESIHRYLRSNRDVNLIHINDDFHARGDLGMVTKLQRRNPSLSIVVISPVLLEENDREPTMVTLRRRAEYVIITKL